MTPREVMCEEREDDVLVYHRTKEDATAAYRHWHRLDDPAHLEWYRQASAADRRDGFETPLSVKAYASDTGSPRQSKKHPGLWYISYPK